MTKIAIVAFAITVVIGIIFLYFTVLKKDTGEQHLVVAPNFSLTKPQSWYLEKQSIKNQFVMRFADKKVACAIDVFIVKPTVTQTPQQWLSTSLFNKVFLENAKESTPEGIPTFVADYKFPDGNLKIDALNKRTLYKIEGYYVDFLLSYDPALDINRAQKCIDGYETVKNSFKY